MAKLNECLLNNVLDKDLRKMLLPLSIMQTIHLQSKYKIMDGFVTPNGFCRHLVTMLGVLFMIIIHTGRLFYVEYNINPLLDKFWMFSIIYDTVSYILAFMLISIGHIVQSEDNIRVILKLQHAHRFLGGQEMAKFTRMCTIRNWVYFCLIYLYFLGITLYQITVGMDNFWHLSFLLTLIYFDANLVFATRVVMILTQDLHLWRVELERFFVTCLKKNHNQLRKYFLDVNDRSDQLLKAYLDIIGAYKLCEKTYQTTILHYTSDLFLHSLVYVQMNIEMSKMNERNHQSVYSDGFVLATFFLWFGKNMTLLICLCVACEKFRRAVLDINIISAAIRSEEGCLADVRRLCKNVSRVNASWAAARALCVGGVVSVDAALPLRLLQLLTTYTVVLLQFAFL